MKGGFDLYFQAFKRKVTVKLLQSEYGVQRADGDFRQAISVRLAQAKAKFGQLWQIWGSMLPRSAQLNLYAAAVIAMLIHGHQAWPLTSKVLKSLKHFNANC